MSPCALLLAGRYLLLPAVAACGWGRAWTAVAGIDLPQAPELTAAAPALRHAARDVVIPGLARRLPPDTHTVLLRHPELSLNVLDAERKPAVSLSGRACHALMRQRLHPLNQGAHHTIKRC